MYKNNLSLEINREIEKTLFGYKISYTHTLQRKTEILLRELTVQEVMFYIHETGRLLKTRKGVTNKQGLFTHIYLSEGRAWEKKEALGTKNIRGISEDQGMVILAELGLLSAMKPLYVPYTRTGINEEDRTKAKKKLLKAIIQESAE